MEVDIAGLLESHRRYMLELAQEPYGEGETLTPDEARGLTWAHDRATTRTLLDLYRTGGGQAGNGQPVTGSASTTTVAQPSRKVKAGSKKAKDRALKAQETRRKNLADKKADAASAGSSFSTGTPVTVNTTTSEAGEGGGQ